MKLNPRHLIRNTLLLGVPVLVAASVSHTSPQEQPAEEHVAITPADDNDSLRYQALSMADYQAVADELGVAVAAIRAVVQIEAGPQGKGFNPDHTPIINFDLTMFQQAARRHGINLTKYKSTHPEVFAAPNVKKYGTRQAAQYARLHAAMEIDTICALESTFWGMFQIGGFNWKLCGCSSVQEYVELTSYSEREQLELFAAFIRSTKLVPYLQRREWAKFALRYNGPGYKKRGYDTKMAAAYAKFSK